jgi:signal transduction histidine kinase
MSPLSIRARMAAAFAAAMLAVLVLAGVFVYLYVGGQLDESLDTGLRTRSDDLVALAEARGPDAPIAPGALLQPEEGFSQILRQDGQVVASTLEGVGPVLDSAELERASRQTLILERETSGVEGESRILARPAGSSAEPLIVVVAASTDDRREALGRLATAFLIGAPVAVLLASGIGYLLAARSLRPVEAMRGRAEQITLRRSGERLPLPRAEDEIHDLGETLNGMLARIEQGLEREREFAADASHELRTPLANMRAELELAERPGRSPGELHAAIESVAEEVERLTRLANDLLLIARSDQGRLPVAAEPTAVVELLRRVAGRFTARAGARTIAVEADPSDVAEIDPLRLEQALGNCVDNALRHGAGEIALRGRLDGGDLVLEVADQGRLAAGLDGRAFERFTRGGAGRTAEGAGLGLAIVRAIARAHGGDAEIAGGAGEGTTVRLRLPAAVGVPAAAES